MLCRSKAWIIDHLKAKQSPWISADQSIGDPFFPFVLGMPSMIYAWLRRNGIMLGFSYANHVNIHHILMFFRENGWNLECPLRPSNSWIYTLMVFHLLTGLHRKICEITSQNPMKTTDSLKSTPQCYGWGNDVWLPGPSRTSSEVCLEHSMGTFADEIPICCIN